MKKKIHKLFWAWQFEKEEAWINEMAAKGLILTGVGFCTYIVEEGTPGEYQYRIELLDHAPASPESQKYIEFMEETGVESIGFIYNWVYFRKKPTDAPFEIFSDITSKIKHLQKIRRFLSLLTIAEYLIGISNLALGIGNQMIINVICALFLLVLGTAIGSQVIAISKNISRMEQEREVHE